MVELSGSREKVEETVLQPGIFLLHLFIKYRSYHRKEDCHNVYRISVSETPHRELQFLSTVLEQIVLTNHFQKNVGKNDLQFKFQCKL